MDNYLKRIVAQCLSEDNTSLQVNKVTAVTAIQAPLRELKSVESSQAVSLLQCAYILLLRCNALITE